MCPEAWITTRVTRRTDQWESPNSEFYYSSVNYKRRNRTNSLREPFYWLSALKMLITPEKVIFAEKLSLLKDRIRWPDCRINKVEFIIAL